MSQDAPRPEIDYFDEAAQWQPAPKVEPWPDQPSASAIGTLSDDRPSAIAVGALAVALGVDIMLGATIATVAKHAILFILR